MSSKQAKQIRDYLESVLDGDAGERCHPEHLVLMEVLVIHRTLAVAASSPATSLASRTLARSNRASHKSLSC
jgi:hypothetical protein